jgi:hypothetical protein
VILKLEDRFASETMVERRIHAAKFLTTPPPLDDKRWDEINDVLDFFQVVGTITRLGHLRHELTYKWFSYWLLHYFEGCQDYIKKMRLGSEITWGDFVWLHEAMTKYDQAHNGGAYCNLSSESVKEFFDWEIRVLTAHLKTKVQTLKQVNAECDEA